MQLMTRNDRPSNERTWTTSGGPAAVRDLETAAEPDPDAMAVARARRGERAGFDELMQRHEAWVYRTVFRYARDADEALDITQEVFLKVFGKLESFEGRSQFKTWLSRIAVHTGINHVRYRDRRPADPADDEMLEVASAGAAKSRPDQEAGLLAGESKEQLLHAMTQLPERYRMAVELRYIQELSLDEIAAELECTNGAARVVLCRALRRLRSLLAGDADA